MVDWIIGPLSRALDVTAGAYPDLPPQVPGQPP